MTQPNAPAVTAGQVTYTSFDAPGQRGGWQVKQAMGSLDQELQDKVVAKALGTLDHLETIPRFPTADDLLGRPRRVAYGPVEAGVPGSPWAFWHTIPAGPDASGRSNVFNQMFVTGPGWSGRPALWCLSPDWLTPFGADSVREAEMPVGTVPSPSATLQTEAVEFLFGGSTWRVGALCVLVDAVVAAMGGEPPVALLLDDMTQAPLWFMLVELTMSRGTASRLAFSTLERAADQAEWASQGLHLVAVPASDLPSLARSNFCLPFDPDTCAPSFARNEPHRTSLGTAVGDSELSVLVMDRYTSPTGVDESVRIIDQMADRVGDTNLDPRWPLAMGCWLTDPGDLRHECAVVITLTSPGSVASDLQMSEALQQALAHLAGADPFAAWNMLSSLLGEGRDSSDHVVRAAAGFYGQLALGSPEWLSQESIFCVPPQQLETLDTPEQMQRLAQAVDALTGGDLPVTELSTRIRWNALLVMRRLGWPRDERGLLARHRLLSGPLVRDLTSGVVKSLADGHLAATDGQDGEDLLMAVMQSDPEALGHKGRPGHWLPNWFAELFHLASRERALTVVDAPRHAVNPAARFELASCILRQDAPFDDEVAQKLRETVAAGLQEHWGRERGEDNWFTAIRYPQDDVLVPLVTGGPIQLGALSLDPSLMPREWVLRCLLLDPRGGDLLDVMERLQQSSMEPMIRGVVNLRHQVTRRLGVPMSGDAVLNDVHAVMDAWEVLLPALARRDQPDPELLGGVAIRAVAALLLMRGSAEEAVLDIATWLRTPGFRVDVFQQEASIRGLVRQLVRRDQTALWRLLINTHENSPLPTQGREGAAALGKVCQGASTPDLISQVVFFAHSQENEESRLQAWDDLAQRAEKVHRIKSHVTEKFFRKWWRDLGGAKGTGALTGAVNVLFSRQSRQKEI